MDPVRPEEYPDPAGAVLAAHENGVLLSLPGSGTTATGRRVIRTPASWFGSFPAYSRLSGVGAGARVWIPGPDTSTMVLFAAVHARATGARRVATPAAATHACLTPAQLDRYGPELPTGTRVVVAGDRILRRTLAAAQARGLVVAHYYGAAELSFVAAGSGPRDLRPFECVEIAIRDFPAPGTIWVRSPWVCERTEGPPGGLLRDGTWASVGDLGKLTAGVLSVLGRPDAVTTAGATVLVADVEAALGAGVCGPFAVHPVPHPTLGQLVGVTFVDPADRESLTAAANGLPASHRPRAWRLVGSLPLTAAGKVDRRALAEAAADPSPTESPTPSGAHPGAGRQGRP